VDDSGGVHLTGYFAEVVDFDPGIGSELRTSAGDCDVFVAAFDPDGNVMHVETFGGPEADVAAGIAVDEAGHRYLTGTFEGSADFDPGDPLAILTSAGQGDVFVAKLDAAGDLAWARSVGGAGTDRAGGVALDGQDNVYLAGGFQETVDFDPGEGVFRLSSTGGDDLFVWKLDTDGLFCFAQSVGGTTDAGNERAFGIAVDAGGDLAIVGAFSSSDVDLDPTDGEAPFSNQGNPDIVIMELHIADRVRGNVWNDLDQKLDIDGNEPGVKNVKVELYDPGPDGVVGTEDDGEALEDTLTNEHGSYYFFDLPHPFFYLKFTAPDGFHFISDDGESDSDVNPGTGCTQLVWVNPMLSPSDQDAGLNSMSKPAAPLVASTSLEPYGAKVQFDSWIQPDVVNLNDFAAGKGGTLGPADFVLVDESGQVVPGSLIVGDAEVAFVPTGSLLQPNSFTTTGLLPSGTYTATLRSATDGFRGRDWRDPAGIMHPGEPLYGGDCAYAEVVHWSDPVVVGVPDFAQVPGQPVDVPTDVSDVGLPILLSNPNRLAIEQVELAILYDTNLLTIGKSLAYTHPDCTASISQTREGVIVVTLRAKSGEPLDEDRTVLGCLTVDVREDADYGSAGMLITSARVNEGAVSAVADDAVHLLALLGDATGDDGLTRGDAEGIVDVAVESSGGFQAYPCIDPAVLADVTGNGSISSLDAARILQLAAGDTPSQVEPPEDPCVIEIPTDLAGAPGQLVTATVLVDGAVDVESFDLRIEYDSAVLSFQSARLGGLLAASDPAWGLNSAKAGSVTVGIANPEPLSGGSGNLLELDFVVRATASSGDGSAIVLSGVSLNEDAFAVTTSDGRVTVSGAPAVVGRHVFYNHSAFDGQNPDANAADDDAVAPDKAALLPGETATFANYTSYDRGINGIMIDVDGLPAGAVPDAEDFLFRLGNHDDPATWNFAPSPTSITVREGAGVDGSDRISIIWRDHEIQNRWLQVTVLAGPHTGLAEPDVFYFGNAVGETGDSADDARVNAVDVLLARNNPHTFLDPASIDSGYDFNRDARINATDLLIARNNATHFLSALKLISAPSGKTAAAATDSATRVWDWWYELEEVNWQKGPSEKSKTTEEAVDALFGEYGPWSAESNE